MIEEIPEEKEPLAKYDFLKRDEVRKTHEDMETYYPVKRGQTQQVKDDVVKVGRLNIADNEKTPRENKRFEGRATTSYVEKLEKYQKVI